MVDRKKRAKWLEHPSWQGIGVLVATFGVLVALLSWRPWAAGEPQSIADQVRAIERQEREARSGALESVQSGFALHGDGTVSWVFDFVERGGVGRIVVYDNDKGRLRKAFTVTDEVQMPPLPKNLTFDGVPYRQLDPARKRLARVLYVPRPAFEKPIDLAIADGSRALLIPVSVITAEPADPDLLRSTLVTVFWSASLDKYILRYLSPVYERWSVRVPHPLRMELQPGAGFRTVVTATEITIDRRAHLVFAMVGYGRRQIHAFSLPLVPADLEECPALWRGLAPVGGKDDVRRLERALSAGCAHQ